METDSKTREYARLLAEWHGVVGRGESPEVLVADSLTLLPHVEGAVTLIDAVPDTSTMEMRRPEASNVRTELSSAVTVKPPPATAASAYRTGTGAV